jgi:site-specific DNA-methyltransferase (adenine-specific)
MSEIPDASVDLVMTSPPYNIGTQYGTNPDKLRLADYQKLLQNVFAECNRVLKSDGLLIIECADSILTDGVYIQLAGYVQSLCVGLGCTVRARHINFAYSKNGVELPENEKWNSEYQTTGDTHSNCHQIVVLSKSESTTFDRDGEVMYFDYVSTEGHPCPTPQGIYDFVLQRYFKKGMVVADPFMGTAILGADVLKRGGTFIGYELDPSIFELAKTYLKQA